MNYIRTHTFPHPKILLDLADEMGILVSLESGWFFGSGFALDDPKLWEWGAVEHIRNIIRRDKNHPSIILYSVGNEVRWSLNQPAIIKHTPRLRELYEQLDPTRIPYHDGDSSLWDERTQHLISRHYGLECGGDESWWDKSKPLHVGEMGKWHYGQPIDNAVWGDDDIFASFGACHRAVAVEAADTIEQGRSNEVLCLFPWNLSGLDNYRPWPQERRFDWPDPSGPHLKPLRTAPYGSEFAWWEPDSAGYVPGVSFEIIRHAFRPLALVVRERLNHVFDDQPIRHTVTVVNDTGGTISGTLRVRLYHGEQVAWETQQHVGVAQGHTERLKLQIPAIGVKEFTRGRIVSELLDAAETFDRVERLMRVTPARQRARKWDLPPLAVYGDGSMDAVLADHGVRPRRIADLAEADPAATPLLLIEKQAVQVGTAQNAQLERFLRGGGRAVILEQLAGIMPQMEVDTRPAERVHIRGGRNDVLAGMTNEDLEFWGEMPFGLANSDAWVVVNPYRKPAGGATRILVDSAWGDFGHGGLHWAPLVETRVGEGLAIACQLRLTDRAASHPSAMNILYCLLTYAGQWRPSPAAGVRPIGEPAREFLGRAGVRQAEQSDLVVADGQSVQRDGSLAGSLAKLAFEGANVVVCGVTSASAPKIAQAFAIELQAVDLGAIYNLVRVKDDPLLDGVSNQETYWLDKAHYGPKDNVNRPITGVLLRSSQAETLLASESLSCWREFYTLDAKSERLRMPVVTYYLWNGPRESAGGLLRLRHGRGQLILCQVPFVGEDGYSKARIFWTHLLRNLGASFERTLLEGDAVAPPSKRSDGFPDELRYLTDPTPELVPRILAAGAPPEHRMSNHALHSSFDWEKVPTPGGELAVPEPAGLVAIGFQVESPRPRKAAQVEGGLPNPNLQTLMDVFGAGTVRVVVNGRQFEPIDLGAEQQGTVPDIDLEMGYNSVVILWQPARREGEKKLRLAFRNRQRQPEVEFCFTQTA